MQSLARQISASWDVHGASLEPNVPLASPVGWRSKVASGVVNGLLEALDQKFNAAKEEVNTELQTFTREVQEMIDKSAPPKQSAGTPEGTSTLLGFFSGGGRRASRGVEESGSRRNSFGGTATSPEVDVPALEKLLDTAKQCQAMSAESFRIECEALVAKLDAGRKDLPVGALKRLHTRLLFILTRCTRLLQFQKEGFAIDRDLSSVTWTAPGGGDGKKSWPVAEPKLDRAWTARSPERRGPGGSPGKRLEGSGSLPVGTEVPLDWLHPLEKQRRLERIESGLSDWSENLEGLDTPEERSKGTPADLAKAEPFGLVQKVTSWRAAAMRAKDDPREGDVSPGAAAPAAEKPPEVSDGASPGGSRPGAMLPPLARSPSEPARSPSIKKPNEQLRVSIPNAAGGEEAVESPPPSRESSGVQSRMQPGGLARVASEPALVSLQSVGSDQSGARGSAKASPSPRTADRMRSRWAWSPDVRAPSKSPARHRFVVCRICERQVGAGNYRFFSPPLCFVLFNAVGGSESWSIEMLVRFTSGFGKSLLLLALYFVSLREPPIPKDESSQCWCSSMVRIEAANEMSHCAVWCACAQKKQPDTTATGRVKLPVCLEMFHQSLICFQKVSINVKGPPFSSR